MVIFWAQLRFKMSKTRNAQVWNQLSKNACVGWTDSYTQIVFIHSAEAAHKVE